MESGGSKIAIIGGHSAVARRLRLGPCPRATYFVRRSGRPDERRVESYRDIGPRDLAGFEAVINCAGATGGSTDDLEQANVTLPQALAEACREAGVGRLVHMSSFSVFGHAERISETSVPNPISAYGKSKLRGDERMLAAAAGGGLEAIVVRLPAIIEPTASRGKTAKLVTAWCRVGAIPAPKGDIQRSMISTATTARVLARLAGEGGAPIVLAADPEPFGYAAAATAIAEGAGRAVRVLWLPEWTFRPLRAVAPSLGYSLFADSLLDPGSNVAFAEPSDLYPSIAALAAKVVER